MDIISEEEEIQGAALAWNTIVETIYKNPYIPTSNIRPSQKQVEMLAYSGQEALFGGQVGGGKGSCVDNKILTPFGWKRFGDLKIGDSICATDGTVTRVIAYFPRGKQKTWKFTFHDGSSTIVDEDHLWLGWWSADSRKIGNVITSGESAAAIWTTNEIRQKLSRDDSTRFSIPVISAPCSFNVAGQLKGNSNFVSRSIHPYVLGVLIGDGSLTQRDINFTSSDQEIAERIEELIGDNLGKYTSKRGTCISYRFPRRVRMKEKLDEHEMCELAAHKHIPRSYLFASVEERWELLRGLMDTDGWCDLDGDCYFCSVSEKLAKDVQHLARSLGAIVTWRSKIPTYSYAGESKTGQKAFTLRIKMIDPSRMFFLERKKERCADRKQQSMARFLQSVEFAGENETACIAVRHPNQLYITDDFIVTHNTDFLLMAALQYVHVPDYSALLLRRTYKHLMADGGLIPRAKSWIGTKAVWREKAMQYTFPSGATLSFGYYDHDDDFMIYQGGAWSFVGWDELTQFKEKWYTYLFSRLRKSNWVCKNCQLPLTRKHVGEPFSHKEQRSCTNPEPIPMAMSKDGMALPDVPVRVRSTSNPGGPGHEFCRRRFVVPGAPKKFVRSALDDNPGIDKEDYRKKLKELDPITREQLERGNWDSYEGGRFKKNWFREFVVEPDRYGNPTYKWTNADVDGVIHNGWPTCPIGGIPVSTCWNLITVDPAASNEDKNDYTAIGVFAVTPTGEILTLEIVRERLSIEQIVPKIEQLCYDYQPQFVGIEDVAFQLGIVREGQRSLGVAVERLKPEGKGKLVRATPAIIRASEGQIFVPKDEPKGKFPWLEDYLAELVQFTGDEKMDSHDDCCFVAGTLISTLSGDVPIEQVKIGDFVLSRSGFRKVNDVAMTNLAADLWRLETIDGRSVTGTKNHPIWANNSFLPLDVLKYGDKLTVCEKQSFSTASNTTDIQTLKNKRIGIISQPIPSGSRILDYCTGTFGFSTMDQYLKGARFTTSISTVLTTTYRIFDALRRKNTTKYMQIEEYRVLKSNASILRESDLLPQNGTEARKALHGTLNMENTSLPYGKNERQSKEVVNGAKKNTNVSRQEVMKNFAQINAQPHQEENLESMTKKEYVQVAEDRSRSTDTPKLKNVTDRVLRICETKTKAPVYNLTVDGGEYFANGILVHNCDCLAYAVLSLAKHGLACPIVVQPTEEDYRIESEMGIFMSNMEENNGRWQ